MTSGPFIATLYLNTYELSIYDEGRDETEVFSIDPNETLDGVLAREGYDLLAGTYWSDDGGDQIYATLVKI